MVAPSLSETPQPPEDTRRRVDGARAASMHEQERTHAEAVLLHVPLAESVARRYSGQGQPFEDLVQVACDALTDAVRRFDTDRWSDFSSFAVAALTGALKRHLGDDGWARPTCVHTTRDGIWVVAEELTQHLGRTPRPSEIAAALQTDVHDVVEAVSARRGTRRRAATGPTRLSAAPSQA